MQIKVSRQELSRLVGCSREMAGRVLKALEDQGLLKATGKTGEKMLELLMKQDQMSMAASLESRVLALTPIAAFRPRRWRGAILPDKARVSIRVLDPAKRPVSAVADHREIRDVASVDVSVDRTTDTVIVRATMPNPAAFGRRR